MKKLLLHICCAPDATVGIERLAVEVAAQGYFYNPNIHPSGEYDRRLEAMGKLSDATGFPFHAGPYDPEGWVRMVQGLEDEPEKGKRCEQCIRERLMRTALEAKGGGYDLFAAVLTVSPHKDAAMVNRLGADAALEHGIEYLPTDLKKRDGFKRSVQLSREMGLYRQDYCGCEYSRRREGAAAPSADPKSKIQDPE